MDEKTYINFCKEIIHRSILYQQYMNKNCAKFLVLKWAILAQIKTLTESHLPNMSEEIGVRKISPVNSHVVFFASMPLVPSNT